MPVMSTDLQQGFRLGPWKVEPLIGEISGPNGDSQHLEPKVMDVFVCLAEHANELVTREELLDTVWNGQVAADELLTGAISDLRHALQSGPDQHEYIETIPKRGYRLLGQVLPLAKPGFQNRLFSNKVIWAAGSVLATILVLLIALNNDALREPKPGNASPRSVTSIAVLPFVNLSLDEEQELFADGLTEEILNSLARTPDILVASRTSSFAFKGSNEDVRSIARKLNVEHILEGSVRRSGDRVRITVQLVRSSDGFHLWSENYDRTFEDIIEIQEEIGVAIANTLETALDPEALALMVSTGTRSVPAFEAYLQGLAFKAKRRASGDSSLRLKAHEAHERAATLDPGFGLAHREVANFWRQQLTTPNMSSGLTDHTPMEMMEKYELAIGKAIDNAKDPIAELGYRAHKARINMMYKQALRLNSEYLQLRPNAEDAQYWQLLTLANLGMLDEVAETVGKYIERGNLSFGVMETALIMLLGANDESILRAVIQAANEQFGNDVFMLYQIHRALLWLGDIDGAREILPVIQASKLPQSKYLASIRQACAEGRLAEANTIFEQVEQQYPNRISALWLVHMIMGREEDAIALLMELDNSIPLNPLASFLNYNYFDPSPYPNLMAWLEAQGIPPRNPVKIPYRCKLPTASAKATTLLHHGVDKRQS